MTVATFVQPDKTSDLPSAYASNIDAAISVLAYPAAAFAPHEAATPAMTVVVDAGSVQFGITPVAKTAQTSGTITAPTVNPRIDRAVIDSITGVLSIITGAEAASPVAPALTVGKIAIAQIALATSTTTITNSLITDERNSSYIGIIDEDTMASDSAVLAPSQQSVKAYVDTEVSDRVNAGEVSSTGTMVKQSASYTVAKISTGLYRITHSLGDANYTVVASQSGSAANWAVMVSTQANNTVDIITRASGVVGDVGFTWSLIRW